MRTCEYAGEPFAAPRSHPWVGAVADASSRYYDFTASPEQIRSSLEDFVPWGRYAAVEAFYVLLERLNHGKSLLESNDCAFTGPHASESTTSPKALECSGRVMVLFRDLARNTVAGEIEALKNELHLALIKVDPNFRSGVVGTTIVPVRYLALPSQRRAAGRTADDLVLGLGRLRSRKHAEPLAPVAQPDPSTTQTLRARRRRIKAVQPLPSGTT